MNDESLFFSPILILYLLSCSSSENNEEVGVQAIRASLSFNNGPNDKSHLSKIRSFSDFLIEMTKDQMVASGDQDLQDLAKYYFPDSTVIHGFDLHAREIGSLDTFRLVFYEYFDLYSSENQTWLGIFSPAGQAKEVHPIHDVSFEGNISINILDDQLIEIVYYDFFDKSKTKENAIIPGEGFYMRPFEKRRNVLEGYIYEYYQLNDRGGLDILKANVSLSYDRQFPQASARILSFSELKPLSYEEISQMKNEILADQGYIFEEVNIRQHFTDKPWYHPRYNDVDAFLSSIEKINIGKLKQLEKQY